MMPCDPFDLPVLNHSDVWWQGFEVGVLYLLMAQQPVMIQGQCANENQEQVFALASRFGYDVEWESSQGSRRTDLRLMLRAVGDADGGD